MWHQVKKEPIVKEANDACGSQALIVDLAIRGVWETQEEALFDIRVTDTDAKSYLTHSPNQVLAQAEKDKKLKYGSSCEERRAVFTPLCVSVDGLFGKEKEHFVKRIGQSLSLKWDKNYSQVMGWIQARLLFAILRATVLCLRGSRTKLRCLGIEDGAPIDWM